MSSKVFRQSQYKFLGSSPVRYSSEAPGVTLTSVHRKGNITWLVAPGLALIAVTYGLARFAYGLFLPEMREALDLSETWLGLIGAGSYSG